MLNKIKSSAVIIFFVLISTPIFPQEVDIIPYLKEIENGNSVDAKKHLAQLELKKPGDPSVKFLKGVLTENGQEAVIIYADIIQNHARSKYADASLYRLYSYYYALGSYNTAKNYLSRLKKDYPNSPYIKIADKDIPSEDEGEKVQEQVQVQDEVQEQVPATAGKQEQAVKKYKYTIQAGAFTNDANAYTLKKEFEDAGFKAELNEKTVGGTVFKIVFVGKFETDDEAKDFLNKINSKFNLDGRVILIVD